MFQGGFYWEVFRSLGHALEGDCGTPVPSSLFFTFWPYSHHDVLLYHMVKNNDTIPSWKNLQNYKLKQMFSLYKLSLSGVSYSIGKLSNKTQQKNAASLCE
jgi:hypothetical protein